MKRYLPIPSAALLAALTMDATANILPAGKDTGDIMVGVTGMTVALKGGKLLVTAVTPDTPAEGKLEKDDTLLAVDGASLAIQDPRHPLGFAINKAEGRDGRMAFEIERGGTARKVVIQLAPIGSYSRSYPVGCPKSRRIVAETAAFILKHGGPGEGINGNLEGLFLLSTGEKNICRRSRDTRAPWRRKTAAAAPGISATVASFWANTISPPGTGACCRRSRPAATP